MQFLKLIVLGISSPEAAANTGLLLTVIWSPSAPNGEQFMLQPVISHLNLISCMSNDPSGLWRQLRADQTETTTEEKVGVILAISFRFEGAVDDNTPTVRRALCVPREMWEFRGSLLAGAASSGSVIEKVVADFNRDYGKDLSIKR